MLRGATRRKLLVVRHVSAHPPAHHELRQGGTGTSAPAIHRLRHPLIPAWLRARRSAHLGTVCSRLTSCTRFPRGNLRFSARTRSGTQPAKPRVMRTSIVLATALLSALVACSSNEGG